MVGENVLPPPAVERRPQPWTEVVGVPAREVDVLINPIGAQAALALETILFTQGAVGPVGGGCS